MNVLAVPSVPRHRGAVTTVALVSLAVLSLAIAFLPSLSFALNCPAAASVNKTGQFYYSNGPLLPSAMEAAQAACAANHLEFVSLIENVVRCKGSDGTVVASYIYCQNCSCPSGYASSGFGTCAPSNSCPNGGTYDGTTSYCYNVPDCPAGKNRQADCSCAAAGPCAAGTPIGEGAIWQADSYHGLLCVAGCAIRSSDKDQLILIGVPATKNNQPGKTYTGSFVQTGALCSAPSGAVIPSVSREVDPPRPGTNPPVNCVNDANGKSMCIDRERKGCGYLNGSHFCADQLPDNGECFFLGKSGYLCGGNAQPPPPPNASDPPPSKGGDVNLPGNGSGQPGGGDADGDGNPTGDGPGGGEDKPGQWGDYPGGDNGSGNPNGKGPGGECSGSGCVDTSGLAKETTLSGILGSLNSLKDGFNGGFNGGLTGSFAGTLGPARDNLDIGGEIEAKRAEFVAKLQAVKSELSSLVTFGGGGSSGGNMVCPPDAAFTFFGTSIALCSDQLLSSTSTLGTALVFVAMVVALYIVLS